MTLVQPMVQWEGHDAASLTRALGVPRLELRDEIESTQDIAHALAEAGAPSGTLVLADAQRSGRGRQGRLWTSRPGQGVWATIVDRPVDPRALDVLSVRIGLYLAEGLDALSGERVSVKWPNDLLLRERKLAGILVEARWSGAALAWVAIGIGVNVQDPGVEGATGIAADRLAVLTTVVASVRAAVGRMGWLSPDELERYHVRDALRGRAITSPGTGLVLGIADSGALIVATPEETRQYRAGTIQLAEDT